MAIMAVAHEGGEAKKNGQKKSKRKGEERSGRGKLGNLHDSAFCPGRIAFPLFEGENPGGL